MLKTAFLLIVLLFVVGLAFWFLTAPRPLIVNDQKQTASPSPSANNVDEKLKLLQEKVNFLESSSSALQNKIYQLENTKSNSKTVTSSEPKTPVLIPINPGGSINSTNWLNLNSGSITIDPKDYPGYKNAYLIINLSVFQGQGKAFARLNNSDKDLAILNSEVSTSSDTPIRLMSAPFSLPSGSNTYTIQLRTLVEGYQAQAADSFLQITYF